MSVVNSSSSASGKIAANIETQVMRKVQYLSRTVQLARSRKYLEGQKQGLRLDLGPLWTPLQLRASL